MLITLAVRVALVDGARVEDLYLLFWPKSTQVKSRPHRNLKNSFFLSYHSVPFIIRVLPAWNGLLNELLLNTPSNERQHRELLLRRIAIYEKIPRSSPVPAIQIAVVCVRFVRGFVRMRMGREPFPSSPHLGRVG